MSPLPTRALATCLPYVFAACVGLGALLLARDAPEPVHGATIEERIHEGEPVAAIRDLFTRPRPRDPLPCFAPVGELGRPPGLALAGPSGWVASPSLVRDGSWRQRPAAAPRSARAPPRDPTPA